MDLKQLRYFVTVAEELSFSKAAARLHMSQPPLSQQIKALEDDLGVALFVRNRREVRLTEAGTVFLRESRNLLDQFRTAVNVTVHAGRSNTGTLRIGVATSGLMRVIPTLLSLMQGEFPEVDVRIHDMQSDDQVHAIAQGALDIGVVHVRPERMDLARQQLLSEPLTLVLPEGHVQSGNPNLKLADLADESMVALSRDFGPIVFDAMIAACGVAGFSPRIKHTARSPFTIFQMVRMGFGFALVPRSYKDDAYPGVAWRTPPDAGGECVRLEMVWSERKGSELTRKVASTLAPRVAAALSVRAG